MWVQSLLAFVVFYEQRMDLEFCFDKCHSGHEIDSDSFSVFDLILFIVLYTFFSVNDLYHETDFPACLSVLVVNFEMIVDKKVFWLYVNFAVIQSFQVFNFISVLMLANGFKLERRLCCILKFERTWPENISRVDSAVGFCFVDLVVLFDDFEMNAGDVFGVGGLHFDKNLLESYVLFVLFHFMCVLLSRINFNKFINLPRLKWSQSDLFFEI